MKNLGRRILDLERAARGELLGLMKIQYKRAHASEHPLRERPVLLWQIRGWRRQSRASLARLWMTLTATEELKREWADVRVHFTDSLAGGGGSILFEGDEADETEAITSLDTSLIQRGIGEASARLDQTALVYATASTGLAALAGVLVGYFL